MSYRSYSPTIIGRAGENGYSWYECSCCPYGYHIDLDFVRYCESISKEADSRTGSIKRRKDRRRQRQSMEVLLGLAPPIITPLEQNYQVIEEKNSPNITKTSRSFSFNDGFNDAVSDFEKTLQRSNKKRLSNNLPDVTAVSGESTLIKNFKICTLFTSNIPNFSQTIPCIIFITLHFSLKGIR
ncbi:unnamed protein product [Acanthoscelides obtectus]|uniref:Uncharacterized protein n=1 Tax=Acanthoscelides obtectus TaxID=200917 RepID=A0A9P0Q3W5_ACAOB|nr:unnamed protein product [Acanthoscelides obtectus]CAK1629176.1 hypothetical protein AOBTE_LOCUS5616 [Acanthoscelides obtectus]